MPPDRVPEAGALRQWWREIEANVRTKYTADALHLAACKEAEGRDFDRLGILWIANALRVEAAEIIFRSALAETAE